MRFPNEELEKDDLHQLRILEDTPSPFGNIANRIKLGDQNGKRKASKSFDKSQKKKKSGRSREGTTLFSSRRNQVIQKLTEQPNIFEVVLEQ
mmetsp:Transcript_8484/g.6323  ORF Transcript_8484/g.6323 Transcript_8484/m.6323 type:complete len:92 (+) Transcript_8484:64-339(+)